MEFAVLGTDLEKSEKLPCLDLLEVDPEAGILENVISRESVLGKREVGKTE